MSFGWDRHDIDRHNDQALSSESHLDPDNGTIYSPTEETQWEATNDGKGSWRQIGEYQAVVKETEGIKGWWWGAYHVDSNDGSRNLIEEDQADSEEEAREAAEDICDFL